MTSNKTPAKFKAKSLDQFDQALQELKFSYRVGLTLIPFIQDDHFPSCSVIENLNGVKNLHCQWRKASSVPTLIPSNQKWMLISKDGTVYLISGTSNHCLQLSLYAKPHEKIEEFSGSFEELDTELDLLPECLLIERGAPTKEIEELADTGYVLRYFISQKSTAKVIVWISIIIALLGVATPMGFQTFADKILPYSAQGSLIVIVALLLLAAIATSVFQCFHDYQESVLFAKYQNGLGKEVFSRLLDMNIPFFDNQKIGDLTKLVDQIEEASNFLVRQLLASVVSVISLLVVLPFLFFYSPMLSLMVLGIGLVMALTVGLSLKPLRNRVLQANRHRDWFPG